MLHLFCARPEAKPPDRSLIDPSYWICLSLIVRWFDGHSARFSSISVLDSVII